jgi:anti-anti-sigma regulatory factor
MADSFTGLESTLLCAAVPHYGRDIIVDLSGVSAIEAAGIGALVSLQAAGESLTAATPATDPASIPALPTWAR